MNHQPLNRGGLSKRRNRYLFQKTRGTPAPVWQRSSEREVSVYEIDCTSQKVSPGRSTGAGSDGSSAGDRSKPLGRTKSRTIQSIWTKVRHDWHKWTHIVGPRARGRACVRAPRSQKTIYRLGQSRRKGRVVDSVSTSRDVDGTCVRGRVEFSVRR